VWFRRTPQPVVTNEAFARWLRAGSPPWLWFLSCSEVEQEALALIGDEIQRDRAVAIGYAVADPRVAELGAAAQAGDVAAEAALARGLVAELAAKIAQRAPAPRETFGGLGERRAPAAASPARPRTLFGRRPSRGAT